MFTYMFTYMYMYVNMCIAGFRTGLFSWGWISNQKWNRIVDGGGGDLNVMEYNLHVYPTYM